MTIDSLVVWVYRRSRGEGAREPRAKELFTGTSIRAFRLRIRRRYLPRELWMCLSLTRAVTHARAARPVRACRALDQDRLSPNARARVVRDRGRLLARRGAATSRLVILMRPLSPQRPPPDGIDRGSLGHGVGETSTSATLEGAPSGSTVAAETVPESVPSVLSRIV
jgi:hypothetical protein